MPVNVRKVMKNQASPQRDQSPDSARQTLELVAFLVHEFKNSTASITTSASLLAEELDLPHNETRSKLISNILTSSRYLETRTSELLNLVKLEAEGFHLELEPTAIDTIVYRVVDQLLPIARSRNQSLTLNLIPNPPKIIADSLRVEQILHNLLFNATKLTPQGGNISVSTDKQRDYIVIKIQDSSPGIPPEEHHAIFQPYYRLKGDKEKHIPGIGLGLALCKRLVGLHGGRIWVESKENNGNTFAFTLPLDNS